MIKLRIGIFGWQRRVKRSWGVPKPARDLMPAGTSEDALSSDGFFRLAFDTFPLEGVVAPADVQVAIVKRSGRNVLLLSGGNPNAASHNETGGFSIRLPDTFEAAVSSHRVRVTISVKAAQGLADAEFSMAYSTAEVGNSRWQKMSVGNQFETLSFEWDVPKMIDGNSDFVGILPGEAGAIEIAGLALFAIPRAETQTPDSPTIPQPA